MSSIKDLKLAQKAAVEHQRVISELNALVKDIERCEKTMTNLKAELEAANSKYPGPRTTREDIEYLTALLDCAKKKLAWEKQITSLQKRTPTVLQQMTGFLNDAKNSPNENARAQMLQCLESVQAAMERLQKVTPQ
jgi:DNA gyrase/topoisomerase IV subunit A